MHLRQTIALSVATLLISATAAMAQVPSFVSGFNKDAAMGPPTFVPFDTEQAHWVFEANLTFDPVAPPFEKHFDTPRQSTGAPIQLDADQLLPFPVWEFYAVEEFGFIPPDTTVPGQPISDWHEEILTPGWEWVLPGDSRFPDLLVDESLITRDGEPWEWKHIPMPGGGTDPSMLWVEFPPIEPGHVLDIHKALVWTGTEGNRFWGDDAGETFIQVIEYPTPEPASLAVLGLSGLALLRRQRRR